MKSHGSKSYVGHTHLKLKSKKNEQTIFPSPYKSTGEKEKEKNTCNCKDFCITRKSNNFVAFLEDVNNRPNFPKLNSSTKSNSKGDGFHCHRDTGIGYSYSHESIQEAFW